MLCDLFGRTIDYLRLSVTEGCNLRCSYCMPLDSSSLRSSSLRAGPLSGILTFEEITRLVRILAGLGIKRVRLTGGEPLIRRNLFELVGMLKRIDGIEEVLLTTNGVLLQPLARDLRRAGLEKINIHLDTLSPIKFREITRWGELDQVLAGIEEARRVGFDPIKLNSVIQNGTNDGEVEDLLRFAAEQRLILRLIELMPIGPAREMMPSSYVPLETIRRRLEDRYTLIPATLKVGSGPAVYYQVKELGTLVGLISPVSRPFCENCNRIRISADGRFQDCLAYDGESSLRDLLRDPACDDDRLSQAILSMLRGKREGHDGFRQGEGLRTPCMYGIGG